MPTQKSFCRFCHAMCGIEVDVEEGRAIAIRGDVENPISQGFTCIKGRSLPDQHGHPDRLVESRVRGGDGAFVPIAVEAAMDEIAGSIRAIVDRDGPRAVGLYAGTAAYQSSITLSFARTFMAGLSSPSFYTSLSIDQPAKIIAPQLHGGFLGGHQSFDTSDVWMIVGCNSVVSMSGGTTGFPSFNPTRRVRDARARGLDLIVVDPRESELARMADLHLQVRPGEDPALFGGMLRFILDEGLHDADFCDRFVVGLDELRSALQGFDREFVERRTGIGWDRIEDAARRFAAGPRGLASTGTGPNMSPHPNLTELLVMDLNAVCGRFNRVGERVANPGTLTPPRPFVEEAMSPFEGFRMAPQSRIRDLGQVAGELPTAALADEILTPGEGQLRALIVVGGNPILAFPDQLKTHRALSSLELLVVVDPMMTATARLADYVIAPTLTLERPDVTALMDVWFPQPFAMYTPPIATPPAGVIAEWEFLWGLAHRLGTGVHLPGGPVDTDRRPTSDEVLANITTHARVPLDEIKRHPGGAIFDEPVVRVAPGNPDAPGRMRLITAEGAQELEEIAAEPPVEGAGYRPGDRFSHRLISRRLREVFNSMGQKLPAIRAKRTFNPAYLNPADMAELGVQTGDLVEIDSGHGRILGVAEASDGVPSGVVSMAHAWGDLPERDGEVREIGSSTNRLVDVESHYDPISGMATQSAIPVNIRSAGGGA